MLTNLLNKNFDRTILKEKGVFSFDDQVVVTAANLAFNTSQYELEQRLHSADNFMYLDESYLMVKHRIGAKDTGVATDAGTRACLALGAAGLFKRGNIEINSTRLDYNDDIAHTYNIMTKLTKPIDKIVEFADEEFYYPTGFNETLKAVTASGVKASVAVANSDPNVVRGYNRTLLTAGANPSVWSKIPLKKVFGALNAGKLWNNVHVKLNLERNTAIEEIMVRSSDINADIMPVIEEIKWVIPYVKVGGQLADKYAADLMAKKTMYLDFQQLYYQRITTANSKAINMSLFTGSKRPRFFIIGLSPNAWAKDQKINSSAYSLGVDNALLPTVTYASLSINNVAYPAVAYKGSNEGYLRELQYIKRVFGKEKGNDSMTINAVNYPQHNHIIVFDMSHIDNILEEQNSDNVVARLELTLSTEVTLDLHCLTISDTHLAIDQLNSGQLQIRSNPSV